MKIPVHARWPALVVGALTLHGVAWLAVVYLATSNPSYAVEKDYYAKALAWDADRGQERVNAALGWQAEVAVEPAAGPGQEALLRLALTDRDGRALDGASVALEAFHNARAGDLLHVRLEPEGDGRYRAAMPMRRNGLWELRLTIDRGSERFTCREVRHLVVNVPRGRR